MSEKLELIRVTKDNLEKEHICCAISNNKDCQVISKKTWLEQRFDEGLVFLKGNVRGKCFIEYIPAEYAWAPIEADGYMYIDCLWVSGSFKGQGYSNRLLEECIKDSKSKGKKGLVILSSSKKRGYLADYKYLKHKGFEEVDSAEPYFKLMCLHFDWECDLPSFKETVKLSCKTKMDADQKVNEDDNQEEYVLYYSNQCPFTAKYVPLLNEVANQRGVTLKLIHITNVKEAREVPSPFTAFALFFNGKFVTHEILSEKKFEKLIDSMNC